nr:hypothetical protein [Bradyrhizobium sp. CCBAU 21360]
MRAVAGVAPGAVGIDAEVAVGPVDVRLRHDMGLASIRVDDAELAARVEGGGGITLGDGLRLGRDRSRIVCACDRDRHRLGSCRAVAVINRHHEALGDRLARSEVLRGRVVQIVMPLHRAVGGIGRLVDRIKREGAERRGVGRGCRERGRMRVAKIGIVETDGARRALRIREIRRGVRVFYHRAALRTRCDDDRVVCAIELECHGRPTERAIAQLDSVGECVSQRLPGRQRLKLNVDVALVVMNGAVRFNPDASTEGAAVTGSGHSGGITAVRYIFDQQISRCVVLGGRGSARSIVQGEQRLGRAPKVICQHIQDENVAGVFRKRENVRVGLRSIAERNRAAAARCLRRHSFKSSG